jgi:hypothetical protein
MTGFRVTALAFAIVLAGAAGPASADVIYGVTGAGGASSSLYTINAANGAASLVDPVMLGANPISLSGIAYVNGVIYGATNSNSSFNPNSLVTITTTGSATLIGSFPTSPNVTVQSLAYDTSTGMLLGYSKSPTPEGVVTINTATGATAPFGASGSGLTSSSGVGLAVKADGTVYLAPSGAAGTLYTITNSEPNMGQAVVGPTLSGAPLSASQIKAMAFDSLSDLYAIDFQPGTPFAANLVTINPSTGVISNVGTTQNGLVGLAFAAVPEPGSFILTGLAAFGLVLCIWARRRIWITANPTIPTSDF